MAGVPANHQNAVPAVTEGNTPTSHGDFLLHLLRKGNISNNNIQKKDEGSKDNYKKSNEVLPSSLSSFSAEGDPWQLTDPAVAALGPSHNFQNPNPNFPNIWSPMNSVPDQQPLPLHLDQLSRPPPNPSFSPTQNPNFSPYPFQNHYDTRPLQPSPFGPLGGGSHGSGPGPFYGASANGHLGLPPRWVGPSYPYGHMPQALFPDGADIHNPSLDAWQLQNHNRLGNGMDHLRGFPEGFPVGERKGNTIAAKGTENCTGGNPGIVRNVQNNYGARNFSENRNCVSRNDVGTRHFVPSGQEQLIRDGVLQFGSIAWDSKHEKGIDKGSSFNDINAHNAELPHTLQGQNGKVRLLRRSASNQQGRGKPTAEEKVVDGSKAQAAVERAYTRGSSQKGINKGKSAQFRERRDTTSVAGNYSVYRGETRKGSEVQTSLEMERDRNKTNVRYNGKIQSDDLPKDGIRNEAIQFEITRHTTEPSKEFTQGRTDKEGLDNLSFQAGDGDAIKKCRGSQQEWRVKQSQADDHMQYDNFDSFPTITGHLSALNANGMQSCNSNDELYEPLSSRPSNRDEASCSHPLAFPHDDFGSPSVQMLENEQSHNEFAGGVVSEGSRRSTVKKSVGGNHRVDVIRRKYEEARIKDTGGVFRENPDNLKLIRNYNKDGNRSNLALPRERKDLEPNNHQAMPMSKQCRRQLFTKMRQKEFQYHIDLEKLTPQFLTLYESLKPCKEEETKRKQLISCLEKLVNKQWPEARLHLFGSCANAFGVSKSDIDVCLSIDDEASTKAELVLKLADILEAEDMQNVQPLTHARVPIVKFTDPLTGISCDICINNILAIINTKLLHDYAQIDVRLQQLAFMVKHWAKCRQINETYQGTLSSYAYVLMCIHFLQQRKPAILPCLQGMKATYRVTIGEIECAYFDKVDELKDYGAKNKETLGQLLSAFFNYWAFRHDYSNSVISVRIGGLLSKNQKDWTRRIGKERHLICIEDPFEISHDLGRVVDKHSIRVLKDEFQRAAEIMQYDPDPCVTLFEPYVLS